MKIQQLKKNLNSQITKQFLLDSYYSVIKNCPKITKNSTLVTTKEQTKFLTKTSFSFSNNLSKRNFFLVSSSIILHLNDLTSLFSYFKKIQLKKNAYIYIIRLKYFFLTGIKIFRSFHYQNILILVQLRFLAMNIFLKYRSFFPCNLRQRLSDKQ
jgi:hypothetical protein